METLADNPQMSEIMKNGQRFRTPMRIMVIIRHKTAHIHTVVNVNKSNVEMLILQTKGASPTYKRPFEGSHNEDVALGQNECDYAAECLLFLPVTTLS